jgi:hypothetical protein
MTNEIKLANNQQGLVDKFDIRLLIKLDSKKFSASFNERMMQLLFLNDDLQRRIHASGFNSFKRKFMIIISFFFEVS